MSKMDEYTIDQINILRKDCELIKPLVVILCLTYNQAPYIREALEGFVSQKTDFPFIAIVHDDSSTDGTAIIVKEYCEKYPDIIKPIFEKENQYSKRDGTLGRIMRKAGDATGAKYVAICEGDDYWTDVFKLRKQVGFLEANPDYSMCFHKILPIGVELKGSDNIFSKVETKEYFPKDLLNKWIVQTASLVVRKDVFDKAPTHEDFCITDNVLLATCIEYGRIYGFKEVMGVYRRTEEGWTLRTRASKEQIYNNNKRLIKHYKRLNTFYPSLKCYYDKRIMRSMNSNIVICVTLKRKKEAIKIIREGLREYKYRYIGSMLSYIAKGVRNKISKS